MRYPRSFRTAFGVFTLAVFVAVIGLLSLKPPTAQAMPNFARKYGVECNTCHTTIPRLNEFGYTFRAAGFRMLEEIGKPQGKFEFGDYFAARLQARFDSQKTNQPNGAAVANVINGIPGPRTTTNAFSFQEFTMYPITGAWGKHLGSLVELSVSPEDVFEVENAYLRVVFGKPNKFFTSRIGIFHPWEGFGASDRPFSNGRPLFQNSPISAGGRGIPYVFQPWGLDEAGAEAGLDWNKLSLRAAVLNGTMMRWEGEANAFLPFPAQTGPWKGANQATAALGKPFNSVAHNTPDFSANATYRLHPNGGVLSILYYRGNIATPTKCMDGTKIGKTNTSTGETCGATAATADEPFGAAGNTEYDFSRDGGAFRNTFDRIGAYASYPLGKHFLPQAGFQFGRDSNPNGTKFDSKGAFVDGSYNFNDYVTTGVRYDWYRPKFGAGLLNSQWAITPYVNIPLQNGLQFIAEYQRRDFQLNAAHHRQNDTFQFRLIFIK